MPKRSLQLVACHAVERGTPPSAFLQAAAQSVSIEESERTERLARIISLAETLWDGQNDARAVLNRPYPLLDGETRIIGCVYEVLAANARV